MKTIRGLTVGVGVVLLASQAQALADPVVHRMFADELTAALYTDNNIKNHCSSAWGVSMAFSLIYPGCTGDGIDQLRETLGYPVGTNMQLVWKDTTERMLSNSMGQCIDEWDGVCQTQAPLLMIANSVWFDDGTALHPEYEAVVGSFAKQIDLESDDSPTIVNDWVKNSTNGLIQSIVDDSKPLYPPWELIAINSIYLKASWKKPFHESKTNLDTFYNTPSRESEATKAHFMNGVFGNVPYSHEVISGYQIVQLPFASSKMSMIFVLPMDGDLGPVASRDLLPVLKDMKPTRVALSIPKFKFESTYDDSLKAAVIQVGIVAPFSGGALCGLFEEESNCEALFIDKIIQKTVIDVNEIGVEAAAVTAIMVGRSSAPMLEDPILMVCDHPFQFFIYDEVEDLVLFEGRVGAPEVPGMEPTEPLLDGLHSDEDFWSKSFYVDPVKPPEYKVEPKEPDISSSIRRFISSKKCFTLVLGVLIVLVTGFIF